jgi:FkbM family methyltransferase
LNTKSGYKKIILSLTVCAIVFLICANYSFLHNIYISATSRGTSAIYQPLAIKIESRLRKVFKPSSVFEFLTKSYYTFGIPKKGVIHVGARYAEELDIYKSYKIPNVLWIEADPEAEEKLKSVLTDHPASRLAIFAATNTNGRITFHKTSNDGHSSSILSLKKHLLHYPTIIENKTFEVEQKRIDDFLSPAEKALYNIIVIDVQGAELITLKGTEKTLETIDAIIAELNYDELYEGGVLIKDLDNYLLSKGFTRVDTVSIAPYTGDALYIKNRFFKQHIQ